MNEPRYPHSIQHKEYTYLGKRVILDTAELSPGCYETMLMYPGGREIASRRAVTEAIAAQDFLWLSKTYPADAAKTAPATPALPDKYQKLRDDLETAYRHALAAVEGDNDDGGTCNFDSPTLCLPRWNASKTEQACKEAGGGCWKWNCYGTVYFVLSFPFGGQGNRRTKAAEAMHKALAGMGYETGMYYAMD